MGALGDIVHALPVLAALEQARPDVAVDWLVDARHAAVLGLVEGVGTRVVVRATSPGHDAHEQRFGGAAGAVAAVRYLRAQRYEAAVDLQGLIKSAVFARASGARRVIGFVAGTAARRPGGVVLRRDRGGTGRWPRRAEEPRRAGGARRRRAAPAGLSVGRSRVAGGRRRPVVAADRPRRPLRAAESRRGLAEQAVAAGAIRRAGTPPRHRGRRCRAW